MDETSLPKRKIFLNVDNINTPKVFIVVLTYNSKRLVLSCLANLANLNKKNFSLFLVVVDNGSTDGTADAVIKNYPEVTLIDNKKNYGFAKGINYGLRFAYQQGADWMLLLNDDTVLPRDFLQKLLRISLKKNYDISGPKIKTLDNKIWSLGGVINPLRFSGGLISYGEEDKKNLKEQKVDFISGTVMLVKKKVFARIGFLDEDYFLYYDDVDFCYRALQKGFLSYLVPQAEITHLETATIKKNSPSHYYHAAKSRLIFVFKRAPFIIKIRELIRLGKTIIELIFEKNLTKRKYEFWAICDFFCLKFGQNTSIKPK